MTSSESRIKAPVAAGMGAVQAPRAPNLAAIAASAALALDLRVRGEKPDDSSVAALSSAIAAGLPVLLPPGGSGQAGLQDPIAAAMLVQAARARDAESSGTQHTREIAELFVSAATSLDTAAPSTIESMREFAVELSISARARAVRGPLSTSRGLR